MSLIKTNFWSRLERFILHVDVSDFISQDERQFILSICREQIHLEFHDNASNEDLRIREARRLMIEVTRDEWEQKMKDRKEFEDNMMCECGHKHVEHTKYYNINYTGGFCMIKGCKCRNFIYNK